MTDISIRAVRTPEDVAVLRDLFQEYAEWLSKDHGISLEFQGIDAELASLPGKYAPPRGEALLAFGPDDAPYGCIAVRPFDDETCEIKRLYVPPVARGRALGKALITEILTIAKAAGYQRVVLDTGGMMRPAQALYERFGFTDIPPYYENPYPGVRYMGMTF